MAIRKHECTLDEMRELFSCPDMDDKARDLLGQSMFYYCCGKDPTPIVAFSGDIPLYIYVDNLIYSTNRFSEESEALCTRLKRHHFHLLARCELPCIGKLKNADCAMLTRWKGLLGKPFYLLFIQCDAVTAYTHVYADKNKYIQPKYVCNYRYEIDSTFFQLIEQRAQYIMGYCCSDKYRCIGEFDYLGDYETQPSQVKLYRRLCYYV